LRKRILGVSEAVWELNGNLYRTALPERFRTSSEAMNAETTLKRYELILMRAG
jgi:hypothetical protein